MEAVQHRFGFDPLSRGGFLSPRGLLLRKCRGLQAQQVVERPQRFGEPSLRAAQDGRQLTMGKRFPLLAQHPQQLAGWAVALLA